MKRIIITALTLCILTVSASAQLLKKENKTEKDFSQWRTGVENTLYFNWQKQFEEIKAKQARKTAAINKAYAAIPEKAKTKVEIKWHEPYINGYTHEEGTAWAKYTCSAILLDYNEKNGLGTVNVALKSDCFKFAKEESLENWFTFSIFLYKFNSEYQEESFIYEYDSSVDTADLKPFRYVRANYLTTDIDDYYQFYMPVRTPALQEGLRKLFPNKKSFITSEQAALALKKMPAHSKLEYHISTY